jgi:3-phenylpropionate/cinnamic acid dioxygenase small subunit
MSRAIRDCLWCRDKWREFRPGRHAVSAVGSVVGAVVGAVVAGRCPRRTDIDVPADGQQVLPARAEGASRMSIEDRLAITELLYRYAELIDAGDFDGLGQLLSRGSFAGVSGAEAIAKLFAATTRRYPDTGTPRTRHLVLNPIIEVADDGTATARSTFCVVQATDTVSLQPIVVGRYFDAFACDDAGWYFTERGVDVEMIGDVSAHLMIDPRRFDQ